MLLTADRRSEAGTAKQSTRVLPQIIECCSRLAIGDGSRFVSAETAEGSQRRRLQSPNENSVAIAVRAVVGRGSYVVRDGVFVGEIMGRDKVWLKVCGTRCQARNIWGASNRGGCQNFLA